MPTLDDLPPYRRAMLLWLFSHWGVLGVEARVRDAEGPCMPPRLQGPSAVAVLGDDGRFHLVRDGRMLCAQAKSKNGWQHRHFGGEDAVWWVQAAGRDVSIGDVPPEQRCPGSDYGTFHRWPPKPAKTLPVQRLRAALIDALGPDCHLCGAYPGAMVDHDYATGMVRGLLCGLCNRVLEECPHVDGCPRAEYMSSPPAEQLALVYPRYLEWKPTEATRRRKIADLGFDPLAEWRPGASG